VHLQGISKLVCKLLAINPHPESPVTGHLGTGVLDSLLLQATAEMIPNSTLLLHASLQPSILKFIKIKTLCFKFQQVTFFFPRWH
jgi:hypothetical protein